MLKHSPKVPQTMASLSVVLLISLHQRAASFPTGAPPAACSTMTPQHGTNQPRTEVSPYAVLVSKKSYSPGENINVMLRGLCGTSFLGFLVQARRIDPRDSRYQANPTGTVGTFQTVTGAQYRCGNVGEALTHNGRFNGTSLFFNWTAPPQPQGHVQIKATFVQKFDTMWTSVASVVIMDPRASPLTLEADKLRTPFIQPCDVDKTQLRSGSASATNQSAAAVTTTNNNNNSNNNNSNNNSSNNNNSNNDNSNNNSSNNNNTATGTGNGNATSSLLNATTSTTTTNETTATTTRAMSITMAREITTAKETIKPISSSTEGVRTSVHNIEISTSASNLFVLDANIDCGKTHGCFHQCTNPTSCQFRVAWKPLREGMWFDVMVPLLGDNQNQWLALAFSQDRKMGEDSVVECLTENGLVTSRLSFNDHHDNNVLPSQASKEALSGVKMTMKDGFFRCQFIRRKTSNDSRVYGLDKDWYLLVAQGYVHQGDKKQHIGIPTASERRIGFQTLQQVGVWHQDKLFIKLHACLMSFAWIFCAGFGIVIARYSKPLWPTRRLCGRKVWFTVHRGLMTVLGAVTLAAFVIIFLQAEGLVEMSFKEIHDFHPLVGIVSAAFTILQISIGIFRPSSTSKNRPVFNWGHGLLGVFCHIVAVFNVSLGLRLRKAGTHFSATYVLYAYAIYQICMIIVLEIISCNIRMKEKKSASYTVYERRNVIYSSTKEMMEDSTTEPPGSSGLRIVIRVHLLFVTAFTATLIALVSVA